jgi:hypothetical protein
MSTANVSREEHSPTLISSDSNAWKHVAGDPDFVFTSFVYSDDEEEHAITSPTSSCYPPTEVLELTNSIVKENRIFNCETDSCRGETLCNQDILLEVETRKEIINYLNNCFGEQETWAAKTE